MPRNKGVGRARKRSRKALCPVDANVAAGSMQEALPEDDDEELDDDVCGDDEGTAPLSRRRARVPDGYAHRYPSGQVVDEHRAARVVRAVTAAVAKSR